MTWLEPTTFRGIMSEVTPPPPPPNAGVLSEEVADLKKLSFREKVELHSSNPTCRACHSRIDPIGFSLENYDALGRWRGMENKKPVNATSDYKTQDGKIIPLDGARSLAKCTAGNADARKAFIRQMFHYMIKQPTAAYGGKTVEKLYLNFRKSKFNVKKLIVEALCVASMHGM